MGIESNKEAYQTMKNSIGSMENRMREIYNKGYKDGIKEGINQAMQKIADSILEEVEVDRKTENSSEKPNNCEECEHWNDTEDGCADRHGCKTEPQTVQPCDGCEYSKPYIEYKCIHHSCKYEDEPQTDCAWR